MGLHLFFFPTTVVGISVVVVVETLDLLHGLDSAACFLNRVKIEVVIEVRLGEDSFELCIIIIQVFIFITILLNDLILFASGVSFVVCLDFDGGFFLVIGVQILLIANWCVVLCFLFCSDSVLAHLGSIVVDLIL